MEGTNNEKRLTIKRYNAEFKSVWDDLISKSANGNFLFNRSFMDYHQDKFEDFSHLIWNGGELTAVFVAGMSRNRQNDEVLVAHPGLTCGGLITLGNLKYSVLEEVYRLLLEEYKKMGVTSLAVKLVPRVFCRHPSDADLFFFYKNSFHLSNRELNTVIDLTNPLQISRGRKSQVRKAIKNGVIIEMTEDYAPFWQVLTDNLQQTHKIKPVHTLEEIQLLYQKNPDNIKLYVAKVDNRVVAGVVTFSDLRQGYVHTQYISNSEEGKLIGAVDAVLMHVVQEAQVSYSRFSFGISTVKGNVNYGLLNHKEGYSTEAEIIDTYEKIF